MDWNCGLVDFGIRVKRGFVSIVVIDEVAMVHAS